MKKLLALIMFVSVPAFGEYLPTGCYVAHNNPGKCWTSVDQRTQWIEYADRGLGASIYGVAVEAIINENAKNNKDCLYWASTAGSYFSLANECADTLTTTDNSRQQWMTSANQCTTNLTGTETNRQEWIAYAKSLEAQGTTATAATKKDKALIKKLQKACGKKCKKIK